MAGLGIDLTGWGDQPVPMSKSLSFVAFANSVNQGANLPGQSSRTISLQGVTGDPRAKPAVAGPNDDLFDVPGSGRAQVNLTGLNAKAIDGFKGGARYKVTITEIHEAPAAAPAPALPPTTPVSPSPSAAS